MEEIQVGEYVRTEDGIIAKILRFENEDYGDRGNIVYGLDREAFDKTEGFEETSEWVLPDQIVKHSKNIIDLIEVGDYVNGYKVEKKGNGLIYVDYCWDCNLYTMVTKQIEDIKSIVTKEQFETMKYKLEE